MSEALAAAGIAYEHTSGLGNPDAIRAIYLSGDAEGGHGAFRERLRNGASAALNEVAAASTRTTVALLCRERDAQRCHRQVIANVIAERDIGRPVVHL